MTACKLKLMFEGMIYPEICPSCDLEAGYCTQGFRKINKNDGDYELVDNTNKNSKGLFVDMNGLTYLPQKSPPNTSSMSICSNDKNKISTAEDTTVIKITRIQRARLLDWVEAVIDKTKPYSERHLNELVDEIVQIITKT